MVATFTVSNWNMFSPFPSRKAWTYIFSDLCVFFSPTPYLQAYLKYFFNYFASHFFQWNLNLVKLELNPIQFNLHAISFKMELKISN